MLYIELPLVAWTEEIITSVNTQEDTERRIKFYNGKEVAKLLSKSGAPRTKGTMMAFIAAGMTGNADAETTQESFNCFSHVSFEVHPQQINVRDKANGKIIAVIPR